MEGDIPANPPFGRRLCEVTETHESRGYRVILEGASKARWARVELRAIVGRGKHTVQVRIK